MRMVIAMRRCEDCKHSKCEVSMTPSLPDLWVCKARGGMAVFHPVLRALTCRGYESMYKPWWRLSDDSTD